VGLLVDWLKDGYQSTVFAGVADAARERDVNLLCFAGGTLGTPQGFSNNRNLIYEFVGPHSVDGLVLLSGTLGSYIGPSLLAAYCERFGPLPMVSIAAQVGGMPTVIADTDGMRDAIRHLIDAHGYRQIAFIRGPEDNQDANLRFAAYREVLRERGIAFDAALVHAGDFQPNAGAEAVRVMLDERKATFEAVVAANDYMAMGAMEALAQRGIEVPQRVAVIGFDDVDEARFATPPLTTVRQPLYEQGRRALDLLMERITAGGAEPGPAEIAMQTELIVRESCGCSSGRAPFRGGEAAMVLRGTIQDWLGEHRDEVASAMRRAVRSAGWLAARGWEALLLDAFADDVLHWSSGLFDTYLRGVLRPVAAAGGDVSAWQEAITSMRRALVPALITDPARWLDAEDLWQAARVTIAEIAESVQARQRLHVDRWSRALSETSEALLSAVDTGTLARTIAQKLPQLGIGSCFLSTFAAGGEAAADGAPPAEARLMLAYDASRGGAEREPAARAFPARELMPADAWPADRRWTFIVEPLTFEAQQFGMVLFERGPREGIIYESLREQISSGLNSARLIEQVVSEATRRQIAERRRLEQEMELASRIQTSILPCDLRIDGLEIAAAMQPASEVGGDYYDVFPVEDGCWIGIGDVAGHGLSTGLVMLMIQSGFATLGRQSPRLPPSQLLPFLNDVIYDNVRVRLSHDEHATLTLLRYHRDGVVRFAGAHEEIVVYRQRTGACEVVPTPGPWLGACRNVTAAVTDSALRLEDGDVMVLYTDGVIEARSAQKEPYGLGRLCAELVRTHDQPVLAIRDRLLGSVRQFMDRQDDDMTIVVGRYRARSAGIAVG
jgi:DNA-binding LacI/PurR family transcriptional regulator/serine phosphatase RsbU (regulator of sigma subunit)